MKIWYQIIAVSGLASLLTACDPLSHPETLLDEYVKRLGYVLEVKPSFSEPAAIQRLPRTRQRILSIPETDITFLDFLSLYGCELQFIVGERNSILGRVMQPLNTLRYEVRFLEAAQICLTTIKNEVLRNKLADAINHKQQYLSSVIWNATWGTSEITQLLSLSNGLYDPKNRNEIMTYGRDIAYLNDVVDRLSSGEYAVDLAYFGHIQQRWQYGSRAGQLLNSARLSISRLNDATRLLQYRTQQKPLCLQRQPNNQYRLVESMFNTVYISKVQPYLVEISRGSEQLFSPLTQLASNQKKVMPETFTPYFEQTLNLHTESGIWNLFRQSIKAHTQAWQQLLDLCGQLPAQRPKN